MINYQIDSDFSNVKVLAKNLRNFCLENNIDENTTSVLELMLVEAINNVVEHAYKGKSGFVINTQFDIDERKITITIIDEGSYFLDPENREINTTPENAVDELPEGGWGLGLIESIADNVEKYNVNGTNILVLTKNIGEVSHA